VELHSNPFDAPRFGELSLEIRGKGLSDEEIYKVKKMVIVRTGKELNLIYNEHITLSGIPLECERFKINGRSPLEWIVNQFQLTTDKDTGIVSDPNLFASSPTYIVDLISSAISVSTETVAILETIPKFEYIVN
jgi:predicted helicase